MFGIKYILHLFLCVGGWACNKLGMGPGLVSMSPHSISRSCGEYVWKWSFLCLGFLFCTLVLVLLMIFFGLVCCFVLFLFVLGYMDMFLLCGFLFFPCLWARPVGRVWFMIFLFFSL